MKKRILTDNVRQQIRELDEKGEKATEIAQELGIGKSTISKYLIAYRAGFESYKEYGDSKDIEKSEEDPFHEAYLQLIEYGLESNNFYQVDRTVDILERANKETITTPLNLEKLVIYRQTLARNEIGEIAKSGGATYDEISRLFKMDRNSLEEIESHHKKPSQRKLKKRTNREYGDLSSKVIDGKLDGEIIYTEKQISECFGITKRNINKLEKNELMVPEGKIEEERVYSTDAVQGLIDYFEEGRFKEAVEYGFEIIEIPTVDNKSHQVDDKLGVHEVDSVKKTKRVINRKNLSIQK